MKDVTFKSFVIGELYIFIILEKNLRESKNSENHFVYFLHDRDFETGERSGEYLFIIYETGAV